nr:PREDICTED: F-box protein At1g10110-like isoform X2 [Fragaria vesca subsp. vesca]
MECSRWLYDTILEPACLYVTKKYKIITTGQRQNRAWSDLPPEILSLIAERAGLFELLSLFRVCNAWRSTSTALAQMVKHELNQGPWFLLYEDNNPECQMLTASGKKFITSLPELNGTTCLASYHGWLLLFRQGGTIFFFHVFSRQRIDLPEFPVPELTDHVGAVSSSPTSQDCVVCVISCSDDETLDAKVLHLRDQTWIGSEYSHPRAKKDKIKCGIYSTTGKGMFGFLDGVDFLTSIAISAENRSLIWNFQSITAAKTEEISDPSLSKRNTYHLCPGELEIRFKDLKNKLGLTADVTISSCGTITPCSIGGGNYRVLYNESISDNYIDKSKNRCFKGVLIQPRSSIHRRDMKAHSRGTTATDRSE